MADQGERPSWIEHPEEVIVLVNPTTKNFILELPTGRCRLDAGRRIRTLRSITQIRQVKELIEQGELVLEEAAKK